VEETRNAIKEKRPNMSEALSDGQNEHEQEEMDVDITEIERPGEEEKTEAMQRPKLTDILQRMTSRRNEIIDRHVEEVMGKRVAPFSPQE
jgi:hypothetical protein